MNHFSTNSMMNLCRNFNLFAEKKNHRNKYHRCVYLFEKDERYSRKIVRDENDREYMLEMLAHKSHVMLRNIASIGKTEEVAIWAANDYVSKLLTFIDELRALNIKRIVDRDPVFQGKTILGIEIKPPVSLKDFKGTIVVPYPNTLDSIKNDMKKMGMQNRVVYLHGD